MIDEQKLRELAEAATPGPWTYYADDNIISSDSQPTAIIALAYRSVHCTVEQRIANGTFAAAANPAAILALLDELATLREEISELRGQFGAWQKLCDTLTHQVLCCGVAASHPDATLTTRGAYAGKWNSAQAEEVRKLRAECDKMRSERTAWRVSAENAEAAVKQAREDALEDAKKAVDSEGFSEPEGEYEAGYNKACDVCVSAIESLKGKTP